MTAQFSSQTDHPDETITNDGFYPNLSTSEFRNQHRIASNATNSQIIHQITTAIDEINQELKSWREQQSDINTLAASTDLTINQINVNVKRYKTAVYSIAKVKLINELISFDTTRDGESSWESQNNTIGHLLNQARQCLQRITQTSTTSFAFSAELI